MPQTDVLILGATPGGLMAGIAAAEAGSRAVVLERSAHIGGLPANGLGATDIATRGATAGLFRRFTRRVQAHYDATYGRDSQQAKDASDGHHFEPSVAEAIFTAMVAETKGLTVLTGREFAAKDANVRKEGARPVAITVRDLGNGQDEVWEAAVFIDATYEGDLAAACGAPFRLGREGRNDLLEAAAGPIYQAWRGPIEGAVDGKGDHRVQAYNYRLCLTDDPVNQVPVPRPATYDASEYESLIGDVRDSVWAGKVGGELHLAGIGRLTNMVILPNRKTDANNQHLAFISTDLPEENQDWPTADWAWRDRFAQRLRDYICGLIWFAQHDERLPVDFRDACLRWGFAKDEYVDNANFPRQVYVREGRRIEGDHLFTAHDALPVAPGARPPVHGDSITASHYALDSHACRKREPGRPHLEGFLSTGCAPYTVPMGVMLPKRVEWLLSPVAASATHIGFSTLRMEPCWMALGEAAGLAAATAVQTGIAPRSLDLRTLQDGLLARGAVLIHVRDVGPDHPDFAAVQRAGVRGLIPAWEARLDEAVDAAEIVRWWRISGQTGPVPATATRGDLVRRCFGKPVARSQAG